MALTRGIRRGFPQAYNPRALSCGEGLACGTRCRRDPSSRRARGSMPAAADACRRCIEKERGGGNVKAATLLARSAERKALCIPSLGRRIRTGAALPRDVEENQQTNTTRLETRTKDFVGAASIRVAKTLMRNESD